MEGYQQQSYRRADQDGAWVMCFLVSGVVIRTFVLIIVVHNGLSFVVVIDFASKMDRSLELVFPEAGSLAVPPMPQVEANR